MKKIFSIGIMMTLVLTIFTMTVNSAITPPDSNTNDLNISIIRVSGQGPYHVGDVIEYSCTIYVGAAGGGIYPADCQDISAYFTRPDSVVVSFNVLPSGFAIDYLARGTSVHFYASSFPGLYYVVQEADITAGNTVYAEAECSGISWSSPTGDAASDDVSIQADIIEPSTDVTLEVDDYYILTGDDVVLTITETNDGDGPGGICDLESVSVDLYVNSVYYGSYDCLSTEFDSTTDIGSDDILSVGETWEWEVTVGPITGLTLFEIWGFGIDEAGSLIGSCNHPTAEIDICDPDEYDWVEVTVFEPTTYVTLEADDYDILTGDDVVLTITETNDGDVDLTGIYVELWQDGTYFGTFDVTDPYFTGVDIGGDSILSPAETWEWEVTIGPITADTTFEIYGFGTDPAGNLIGFCNHPTADIDICDSDEYDFIDINTFTPSTYVTLTADDYDILTGDDVVLTICETNDGDVDLDYVYVELWQDRAHLYTFYVDDAYFTGTDNGDDDVLSPGETWCWDIIVGPITADTIFEVYGFGNDPAGNLVGDCDHPTTSQDIDICDPDEYDILDITTFMPSTTLSLTSDNYDIYKGDYVTLTICETNDGDVDLDNVYLELWQNGAYFWTLDVTDPYFIGTDIGDDDILSPGETWTWDVTIGPILANTFFEIYGFGRDPLYNLIGSCNHPTADIDICDSDEYAFVNLSINVINIIIDIKPGDYPNIINPNSKGKIPVAIITTEDFNASEVNPESIEFLSASPTKWVMDDVDKDGDIDLLLHFKTQELNFSLLVYEGDEYPYAYLYGETNYGVLIEGKDTVRLVGEKSYTIIDWVTEHFPILVKLFQHFPIFEKILNQIN